MGHPKVILSGFSLTSKYKTWLKTLTEDERSSLYSGRVSIIENGFYNTDFKGVAGESGSQGQTDSYGSRDQCYNAFCGVIYTNVQ